MSICPRKYASASSSGPRAVTRRRSSSGSRSTRVKAGGCSPMARHRSVHSRRAALPVKPWSMRLRIRSATSAWAVEGCARPAALMRGGRSTAGRPPEPAVAQRADPAALPILGRTGTGAGSAVRIVRAGRSTSVRISWGLRGWRRLATATPSDRPGRIDPRRASGVTGEADVVGAEGNTPAVRGCSVVGRALAWAHAAQARARGARALCAIPNRTCGRRIVDSRVVRVSGRAARQTVSIATGRAIDDVGCRPQSQPFVGCVA